MLTPNRAWRGQIIALLCGVLLLGVVVWRANSPRGTEVVGTPALSRADAHPRDAQSVPSVSRVDGPGSAGATRKGREVASEVWASPDTLFRVRPAPADAAAIEARAPLPADWVRYVEVNLGVFATKDSPLWRSDGAGTLRFSLPGLGEQVVEGLRTEILGPQRYVVQGELRDRPGSRVLVTFNQDAVAAQVYAPGAGEFHLRGLAAEEGQVAQLVKVAVDRLPPCGGAPSPSHTADIAAVRAAAMSKFVAEGGLTRAKAPRTAEAAGPTMVARLLFLYTGTVRTTYGTTSQVETVIDLAVAAVNSDFANSEIPLRIQLAAAQAVTYSETGLNYSRTLGALRGVTDGTLDSIHAARDEALADLVTIGVMGNDSGNSLGIAYLLDEPNDYVNPFYAFSVVQFPVMATASVLSHEIGHNLGCAHDRENTDGPGAYSFSYGYRFSVQDKNGGTRQFRDIMAYAPGTRLPYFSNPRIKLSQAEAAGVNVVFAEPTAIGIAGGQPGESDGARTITENAFEVANYRISADRAYDVGTLINVSTRAFVGTDAQQLIGGFIVDGAGTKRVLVRAVGPALAPFGVTGTLADPRVRIFRLPQGDIVGENDNWGVQPNPQETTVRGFPFPSGSRDSAILLSLPAGSYTANVEGVGGTTGVALVEAYEIDSTVGQRLLNLSTRAYADRGGREMVAGFVIAPEELRTNGTKRVLIRVLGPTLSQFGVPQVLGDPMMTLFDGTGRRLREIDDWDPPSTSLTGGARIARGTVDQPSEQAVFDAIKALNLPAMTPLEPALVTDLPPGSYTVVVQPFEAPDQPAQPGVGIVEVYELRAP